ncbi:serine hydrolase domain-containing protein [Parvularcula marina]|uniref:Serine hydrolase n=1 Tax=Parvularcula marina TaxID=2292771 RepID=A0A371RH86_9PROT|nr:serine hydrolase [Parvularcula marina]RFB04809.1 serine hydrolase [Parvularcula marina]
MPTRNRVSLLLLGLATGMVSACAASGEAASSQMPAASSLPAATEWRDVDAAIEAAPFENIRVIIGTTDGIFYEYEKGNLPRDEAYFIASASKMLTGLTFTRLVEEGVMSWDDQPQDYLDWWTKDPADPRSDVTLSQLLAFTSGFNDGAESRGCIRDRKSSVDACAMEFYNKGQGTAPGEAFFYGPAHMQIAAAMAEQATGKAYHQLFRETVARPAGLSAKTQFIAPSPQNARASGGARSTAEDTARLLQSILEGKIVTDLDDWTKDRTADARFEVRPVTAGTEGLDWHYAHGMWVECDGTFTESCAQTPIVSSPGAFGWTPWIDMGRGYYGVIAIQERPKGGLRPATESVKLEQAIQPLIERKLDAAR